MNSPVFMFVFPVSFAEALSNHRHRKVLTIFHAAWFSEVLFPFYNAEALLNVHRSKRVLPLKHTLVFKYR